MKILIFCGLFCCNLGFAQADAPWAKFTLTVVDEEGQPIPEAKLKIFGTHNPKGESRLIWEKTNANGGFTYEHQVEEAPAIEVERKKYYKNAKGAVIDRIVDGKCLPYGQNLTIVLPKIINPVPMYAIAELKTELPQAAPTGFDLERHDWVVSEDKRVKPDPKDERTESWMSEITHGLGVRADMFFSVERTGDEEKGSSKVKLTFPNPGDGIIPIPKLPESGLIREAPLSGYRAELVWSHQWDLTVPDSWISQGTIEGEPKRDEAPLPRYFIFRVRTVLNDKGEVVSALYGKMLGFPEIEARSSSKTARINLGYHLNPDGTRNLEFDTKKNLFKNLPDHQNPIRP